MMILFYFHLYLWNLFKKLYISYTGESVQGEPGANGVPGKNGEPGRQGLKGWKGEPGIARYR